MSLAHHRHHCPRLRHACTLTGTAMVDWKYNGRDDHTDECGDDIVTWYYRYPGDELELRIQETFEATQVTVVHLGDAEVVSEYWLY